MMSEEDKNNLKKIKLEHIFERIEKITLTKFSTENKDFIIWGKYSSILKEKLLKEQNPFLQHGEAPPRFGEKNKARNHFNKLVMQDSMKDGFSLNQSKLDEITNWLLEKTWNDFLANGHKYKSKYD